MDHPGGNRHELQNLICGHSRLDCADLSTPNLGWQLALPLSVSSSACEHRSREEALSAGCGSTLIHLDVVIICSSCKMDSDLTAFTWLHAMMMLSWSQQNTETPLPHKGPEMCEHQYAAPEEALEKALIQSVI